MSFAQVSMRGVRAAFIAAALLLPAAVVAAPRQAEAATYVGAALGDVKPEDKVTVAQPQPVQLIFEFRTKGAPNARATKFLKAKVTEAIIASGLFSEVSDKATANGAILNVVIDNVIDPDELAHAKAQGFATGATFFVAGSNVTDHYIGTVEYVGGPDAAKITRTATHTVITQMGMINSPPEGAVKVGKMNDAIFTMARQIVTNPLNEVARDPAFQGGAASAPAASPEAVPAAAPEAAPAEQPAPAPEAAPATPTADPAPKP